MVNFNSLFVVALVAGSAAAAPSRFTKVYKRQTVTVKSGDTCNAIAAAQRTTAAAILAANPSINAGCTNLKVGQVLNMSGGGGGNAAPAPAPAPAAPAPAPAAGGDFRLGNGQAAQKLNAKFATLNAGSSCADGEQACVNGGFAQCVGGKFASTGCAGGLGCFALPLVNKAGTSITCSTEADAIQRIANTGATGGLRG